MEILFISSKDGRMVSKQYPFRNYFYSNKCHAIRIIIFSPKPNRISKYRIPFCYHKMENYVETATLRSYIVIPCPTPLHFRILLHHLQFYSTSSYHCNQGKGKLYAENKVVTYQTTLKRKISLCDYEAGDAVARLLHSGLLLFLWDCRRSYWCRCCCLPHFYMWLCLQMRNW